MLPASPDDAQSWGKETRTAGASGCPWQQHCVPLPSAMAAPRPAPLLPPLAAQDPDAVPKMSLGLEEHLSRAFQDKLRFQ